MVFTKVRLMETIAEENARLADAPVGSTNHTLSLLPVVNTNPNFRGKLVLLATHDQPLIVMPKQFNPGSVKGQYDGSWYCVVTSSRNPSYPVGGYDIAVSESELRRSPIVELPMDDNGTPSVHVTKTTPITDHND